MRPLAWLVVASLMSANAVHAQVAREASDVPSEAPPVARFEAGTTSGIQPLGVVFTDRSIGLVTSWAWDFGDGGSSSDRNPVHVYEEVGSYTVRLTVAGPLGTGTSTRDDLIQVLESPIRAEFSATPVAGTPPLAVDFTDESIGIVTAREWDFGDGTTSTETHPQHVYNEPGSYRVILRVSGPEGEDVRREDDFVQVAPLLPGFVSEPVFDAFEQSTGFLVLDENDIVTWTKSGRVWRFRDGAFLDPPLADLSEEVGDWNDHGLHGFAFDPEYDRNGHVYFYYVVDRHHLDTFGTPAYDPLADTFDAETIGRITRYSVFDPADPATTIDPSTRQVLVGEGRGTGIPICASSHGLGKLVFGMDGSLLFSCGDSFLGEVLQQECLSGGFLRPKDDVAALRSQLVDGPNGKIHRIDPTTGDGLPSNPFFDAAAPRAWSSRVWTLGLRNPYRLDLRPGTGDADPSRPHPGTLYVGDVGYQTWEEISVVTEGGQNLGWPMYEGFAGFEGYIDSRVENLDAPNPLFGSGGCELASFRFIDLLTEDSLFAPTWPNPCDPGQEVPTEIPRFVHRRPVIAWGHEDVPASTFVPGYDLSGAALALTIDDPSSSIEGRRFFGNGSIGGTWYTGTTFPAPFRDVYFHADWGERWIRAFEFDDDERLQAVHDFASGLGNIVQLGTDPAGRALYYLEYRPVPRLCRILYGENAAPTAVAQASPAYGSLPLAVGFSAESSLDPEGAPLEVEWDFGTGAPWSPVNRWPVSGHLYGAEDVTSLAQPIRSTEPSAGAHTRSTQRLQLPPQSANDLLALQDGSYAETGSEDPAGQVLVEGHLPWIGYRLDQPRQLAAIVFQEGLAQGPTGGFLAQPIVEVWNGDEGAWSPVANLEQRPGPGDPELSFETFHFAFDPVRASAVRVRDALPAAGSRRITAGELRLMALQDPLPTGPFSRTATLTVTDPFGETSTTQLGVSLNNTPPVVQILSPMDGETYPTHEPSTVPLFAQVSDAEHDTGSLTCEWRVELVHDNHTHPEPVDVSCASHFVRLPHGELEGDVIFWTVELTVTDPNGLSTSVLHTLLPKGDCNLNGVEDALDILFGDSSDLNTNGVPDECE